MSQFRQRVPRSRHRCAERRVPKKRRKKRPDGRISPLLPISVMAACLALILGATLWFAPHRNPSGSGSTVLDSSQAQTAAVTPADNDTAERELTPSPAPENAPVLDDSVSSLLFSVPDDNTKGSGAESGTLHISDRKTIEALSELLVRTQPTQPPDTSSAPLCTLEETSADGTATRVTVWIGRQGYRLCQQHGRAVLPRAGCSSGVLPSDRSSGKQSITSAYIEPSAR